jgi:hypothetical protein
MFLAKHPSVYQDRLGTKYSDNWKQRRFLCRNTSTPSEGTQSPVLLGWKCSLYANTVFESHLCINAISLPRQARDKHKENSQNTGVLLNNSGDSGRGLARERSGGGRVRFRPSAGYEERARIDRRRARCGKNRFFLPCQFIKQNRMFAKTGSGQTLETLG